LLFAAAMLDSYGGNPKPVWAFLEALDPFVEEPKLVDGHMSSFQLVPSEQRDEARAAARLRVAAVIHEREGP